MHGTKETQNGVKELFHCKGDGEERRNGLLASNFRKEENGVEL
jgi:hypothetical protein